jgi:hypothetical protein
MHKSVHFFSTNLACQVKAVFAYDDRKTLAFQPGDVMEVVKKVDANWWQVKKIAGGLKSEGLAPVNYTEFSLGPDTPVADADPKKPAVDENLAVEPKAAAAVTAATPAAAVAVVEAVKPVAVEASASKPEPVGGDVLCVCAFFFLLFFFGFCFALVC